MILSKPCPECGEQVQDTKNARLLHVFNEHREYRNQLSKVYPYVNDVMEQEQQ